MFLLTIEGIEQATMGLAYSDFERSWVIRHAVQRGIEIVSEAVRRIPEDVLAQYPDIPGRISRPSEIYCVMNIIISAITSFGTLLKCICRR